jgi:hypothetical protein
MKKTLQAIVFASLSLFLSASAFAQTAGTLTVTFTEANKTATYTGGKEHYLAVWIVDNTGKFVKTKYVTDNGREIDHLKNWAKSASNGSTTNITTACNTTDATSAATQSSFTTRTVTWDAKNVSGATNGTVVADGIYKVVIESTWNHGAEGTGWDTVYFSFTKGTNEVHLTPASPVTTFSGVKLDWVPSNPSNVKENSLEALSVSIFPSPSNDGVFTVNYTKASNIKVVNLLGETIYNTAVDPASISKRVDISAAGNGVYFVYVTDGVYSSTRKMVVNK